ncbi:unnamed protein product [Caenorhabditis sp. 36 PRJEB53466]|nr:unnamed protein product [Caenorhabditis sp. 36 PRJEB53466]
MATWTIHLEGGPRRVNHAAVAIGSKIYSFGGYCSGDVIDDKDPLDVHVLDTENLRWMKLTPGIVHQNRVYSQSELFETGDVTKLSGAVPFQRYGHSVVAHNGKAYVWGGRNDDYGACNLLHEYDPENNVWRKLEICGFNPASRDGHTAVVWNQKMYVFGGFEEDTQRFSQETYVFDFTCNRWKEMATKGKLPMWRDFHTASIIDGVMYIFGGRSDHTGQFHTSHDVYDDRLSSLNLTTGVWTELNVAGIRPGGRRSHSTWVHGGKMYLFGGYLGSRNVHYNELYSFDPSTMVWSLAAVRGKYPLPRRRHCSAVVNGKVYLFGGTMPNPLACHAQVNAGTPGVNALADLCDLHVLDFSPSLKQLAMGTVINELKVPSNNMFDALQKEIPTDIRFELYCQVTPNCVANPVAGRHDQSG